MLRIVVDGKLGDGQKVEAVMADNLQIPVVVVHVRTSPYFVTKRQRIGVIMFSVVAFFVRSFIGSKIHVYPKMELQIEDILLFTLPQLTQMTAGWIFAWHPCFSSVLYIRVVCSKASAAILVMISAVMLAMQTSENILYSARNDADWPQIVDGASSICITNALFGFSFTPSHGSRAAAEEGGSTAVRSAR